MGQRILLKLTFAGLLLGNVATSTMLSAQVASPYEASGELNPYVVVVTRTPLELKRVSPSVSYVSSEEIDFWQDNSLVDVLRREPGMAIWSNGTDGNVNGLSIRGANSDQSSFFIDGRRINPGFEAQYNISNLALNNLESVQLQKGPSSVNFGSAGIGGVVSLSTVSAINMELGSAGSISVETGSNDYLRGDFALQTAGENWGLSLGGSSLHTNNERANDQIESHDVQTRFDYQLSDPMTFELLTTYSKANNKFPQKKGNTDPNLGNSQYQNWLISPGLKYSTDLVSLHMFYSRTETSNTAESYFGASPSSTWSDIVTDETSLQLDYNIVDHSLLSLGLLYRNDEYSNQKPYSSSLEQSSAWLQLQTRLWSDLEVRGGVRHDRNSDYENSTNSNVELIYSVRESTDLFTKIGTSFAPPTAMDLAYDTDETSSGSDANTPLQPEESVSYEVGIRQYLLDEDLTINLVAFRNEISNLITYVDYGSPDYFSDTYNVSSATTEGIEFSADFSANNYFDLSLGYTYLTAINNSDDMRLANRPRHLVQMAADYQFTPEVSAGISAIGNFGREKNRYQKTNLDVKDYVTLRLVAEWDLTNSLSIYGRVDNLLDEGYEPVDGYPALGRSAYIGARLKF